MLMTCVEVSVLSSVAQKVSHFLFRILVYGGSGDAWKLRDEGPGHGTPLGAGEHPHLRGRQRQGHHLRGECWGRLHPPAHDVA